MSAPIDCPICLDCIDTSKNCVTTECGHSFHTNCLMTSVAHNGFGCPYCRTKMAEEPHAEDATIYSDQEDSSIYSDQEEEEYLFRENALRGFRFFWNNLNGEEHDEDDEADEQQLEEWSSRIEENNSSADIPSASFVAQKLEQQGISYEELVKIILLRHTEYSEDEEVERFDDKIFGKIRIIVSNYSSEQTAESVSRAIEPDPAIEPYPSWLEPDPSWL